VQSLFIWEARQVSAAATRGGVGETKSTSKQPWQEVVSKGRKREDYLSLAGTLPARRAARGGSDFFQTKRASCLTQKNKQGAATHIPPVTSAFDETVLLFLSFPFFSCVPSILLLLFLQTQHYHAHTHTRKQRECTRTSNTNTTPFTHFHQHILSHHLEGGAGRGLGKGKLAPNDAAVLLPLTPHRGNTHRERNRDTHTGHTHIHAAPSNSRDYSTLANVNEKKQQREKAATNTERGKNRPEILTLKRVGSTYGLQQRKGRRCNERQQ